MANGFASRTGSIELGDLTAGQQRHERYARARESGRVHWLAVARTWCLLATGGTLNVRASC